MNINPVFLVTILAVATVFFLAMKGVKQNGSYENTNVKGFKDKMKEPNTVIIDVRTSAEVAQGAIKGAININVNSPDFSQKISELSKDKTYLVYCRSGARSARACNTMSGVGFTKLVNLQGGYMAWAASK